MRPLAVSSLSNPRERRPIRGPALAHKIARVLNAFGGQDPFLGLSELARLCRLPKATVYRIATALVDEGLLERDGDQYVLGGRLFELGQQVPRTRLYRDAALPYLEDLYVATGQTVHLAIPDGTDVFYIEKIMGHRGIAGPSRVAGRLPMHCTASGKVLMAFGPGELVADVLATGLPIQTPYTIRSGSQLGIHLADIRALGVAIEREEAKLGHGSIAAPVLGRAGVAIAAVSVTSSLADGDPERWSSAVKQAAARLSEALRSTQW